MGDRKWDKCAKEIGDQFQTLKSEMSLGHPGGVVRLLGSCESADDIGDKDCMVGFIFHCYA